MASIKKRTRTARRKDVRTGQIREADVEYWRARYRDDGGKEHVRGSATSTAGWMRRSGLTG